MIPDVTMISLTLNQRVAGSSPAAPTNAIKSLEYPKALLWFIAAHAGSTPEALTGSPPTQALRATLDPGSAPVHALARVRAGSING